MVLQTMLQSKWISYKKTYFYLCSPGVVPACSFPGSGVYVCMQTLLQLNTEYTRFMDSDR